MEQKQRPGADGIVHARAALNVKAVLVQINAFRQIGLNDWRDGNVGKQRPGKMEGTRQNPAVVGRVESPGSRPLGQPTRKGGQSFGNGYPLPIQRRLGTHQQKKRRADGLQDKARIGAAVVVAVPQIRQTRRPLRPLQKIKGKEGRLCLCVAGSRYIV